MIGMNIATDLYLGGTPGQFDLWPWQRSAEETAQQVSARRSFAEHLLFGRKLNRSALRKVDDHQRRLEGQARAQFLWERAERDRLGAQKAPW